jgi:glutamine synthetase
LNCAVADGINEITASLSDKMKTAKSREEAIFTVVKDAIKETKAVRFEGNGYSDDWVKEAEKRGLPHLKTTPEALHEIVSPKSIKLLSGLKVFSEEEIKSRFHVRIEIYNKKVMIEGETLQTIAETQILPAAYQYSTVLAEGVAAGKALGLQAPQAEVLGKLYQTLSSAQSELKRLDRTLSQIRALDSEEAKASKVAEELKPAMESLRTQCDSLETMVADDYWPLPKYREMLFLS